jgi:hypothetical protein
MAGKFLIVEGVNLFCGDHDPEKSLHLTLEEVALPTLQEMYQDHHPGGSRVAIEVAVGIEKLTASFKTKGIDPDLYAQFGGNSRRENTYTAYGVLRDKRTGNLSQLKAILRGRLGQIEPDAMKRGELSGHGYAINEVMHYELHIGGAEVMYWDFFTQVLRQNGTDQTAEERRLLGIA